MHDSEEIKIRLCVDCVWVDANGADPDETSDEWHGFDARWNGWGFAAETIRHGDTCEIREPHFSWNPCDGCGSTLGGDRYDYIAYKIRRDAR